MSILLYQGNLVPSKDKLGKGLPVYITQSCKDDKWEHENKIIVKWYMSDWKVHMKKDQ